MASVLGFGAAVWGVVMALAPTLQVRRMIIRRSSADVSLGYFAVLLPGFALWVAYGLARADWPLVIPNVIALTVGTVTVVACIVVRRRQRCGVTQIEVTRTSLPSKLDDDAGRS